MNREETIEAIIDVCHMDRNHDVYVELVGNLLDEYVAEIPDDDALDDYDALRRRMRGQ